MVTIYKTYLNDEHLPSLVAERQLVYDGSERSRLTSPIDVVMLLRQGLNHHKETEEVFYMLCCDASGRVVGLFEIARGGQSSAQVEIASCMKKALLSGASGLIFAHNHPSGDVMPSREDKAVSERLKKSCELLQIHYNDFIIVGENTYTSFKDSELI